MLTFINTGYIRSPSNRVRCPHSAQNVVALKSTFTCAVVGRARVPCLKDNKGVRAAM